MNDRDNPVLLRRRLRKVERLLDNILLDFDVTREGDSSERACNCCGGEMGCFKPSKRWEMEKCTAPSCHFCKYGKVQHKNNCAIKKAIHLKVKQKNFNI